MADNNLDFEAPVYEDILEGMRSAIENGQDKVPDDKKLTDFGDGSLVMTILRAIAAALAAFWTDIREIIRGFYISTATGQNLKTRLGDFGFTMIEGSKATGKVQVLRPAGQYFRGGIPVGTILLHGDLKYKVTSSGAYLTERASEITPISIEVEATGNGTAYHLGAGQELLPENAVYQSLTFLVGDQVGENNQVTVGGVAGGVDDETPEEARIRFRNYLQSIGKGTLQAIESAVKEVPEVMAARVFDNTRLNGQALREGPSDINPIGYPGFVVVQVRTTADSQVMGIGVQPDILEKIEAKIKTSKSAGIHVYVQPTPVRVIDVEIKVMATQTLEELTTPVEDVIKGMFADLDIDSPLLTWGAEPMILKTLQDKFTAEPPTGVRVTAWKYHDDGLAATDALGKITPDKSGDGQLLVLGTVTLEVVAS